MEPLGITEDLFDGQCDRRFSVFENTRVQWVLNAPQLQALVNKLKNSRSVVWDIETTGLDPHAVHGGTSNGGVAAACVLASFTIHEKLSNGKVRPDTYLLPLKHPQSPWVGQWLKAFAITCEAMLSPAREGKIVGHNVKFDARYAYALTGVDMSQSLAWDTLPMARLLDEECPGRLKQLAPNLFGCEAWDDVDLKYPGAALDVPLLNLGHYAAQDTYWTWRLFVYQAERLQNIPEENSEGWDIVEARLGDLARQCTVPTLRTLCQIEQHGIAVDTDWVQNQKTLYTGIKEDAYKDLNETFPEMHDDPDLSGAMVSYAPTSKWFGMWAELAVDAGYLVVAERTQKTGRPKWSADILKKQARNGSDHAQTLLDYRDATKKVEFLDSWIKQLAPSGHIHATYNLGRTVSGRLSSSDPNMQQVNRQLKGAFIPSPGMAFFEADYSQVELRVIAHIANCVPMIKAFQDGQDLHTLLAASLADKPLEEVTKQERQAGKACIAEGELVTTDHGLVPIQDVKKYMKVWDGLEWVTHDGVIDQGIRDVITYDGLTATPDHKVYLESGLTVEFETARAWNARITRTGAEQLGTLLGDSGRPLGEEGEEDSLSGEVQCVREGSDQAGSRRGSRQGDWLYLQRQPESQGTDLGPCNQEAVTEVPQHLRQVQPQERTVLGEEQGQQAESLYFFSTIRRRSVEAVSPGRRLGEYDRGQDRHTKTLAAGQFEIGGQVSGEDSWPSVTDGVLPGEGDASSTRLACLEVSAPGLQHRPLPDGLEVEAFLDDTGTTERVPSRRVRTFDILNAGLRHRFTVSGRLVSNWLADWSWPLGVFKFSAMSSNMLNLKHEKTRRKNAPTGTIGKAGGLHDAYLPYLLQGTSKDVGPNVQPVWCQDIQGRFQPQEGRRPWVCLSEKQEVPRPSGSHSSGPLRRDEATLSDRNLHLKELRGSRDTKPLQGSGTLHPLGSGESPAQGLQGHGYRQDQQRRALRAGESTPSPSVREYCEPEKYPTTPVQGTPSTPSAHLAPTRNVREGLPGREDHDRQLACHRSDSRRSTGAGYEYEATTRKVKTYDLLNCGPRHRFTVSHRLVANCNFGLAFGMGVDGFITYAENNYNVRFSVQEAVAIREKYFSTWEGLEDWHRASRQEMQFTRQVSSPIGRIRHLGPLLALGQWSDAGRMAVNAPVQGFASDLMQIAAAAIAGNIAGIESVDDVTLLGTVHDSIIFQAPRDNWQDVKDRCKKVMETEVLKVIKGLGCNFKVPLIADVEVGTRWGDTSISN